MELQGVVVNIAAFGCSVDLGIHTDGLLHKSRMGTKYVSDPAKIVKLNQKIRVRVEDIDIRRKRISLSLLPLKEE